MNNGTAHPRNEDDSSVNEYCSINEVLKIIGKPFTCTGSKLIQFINSFETALELVRPAEHHKLLKFKNSKILNEIRTKLLVKSSTDTWENVKDVLL